MSFVQPLHNNIGHTYSLWDYYLIDVLRMFFVDSPANDDNMPVFLATDIVQQHRVRQLDFIHNPVGTLSENIILPIANKMFVEFDVAPSNSEIATRTGITIEHREITSDTRPLIDDDYSKAKSFLDISPHFLLNLGKNTLILCATPFTTFVFIDESGFIIPSADGEWYETVWQMDGYQSNMVTTCEIMYPLIMTIVLSMLIMNNRDELNYISTNYRDEILQSLQKEMPFFIEHPNKQFAYVR